MITQEVYEKYKIPPNLQQHMRRTAAVALQICDNWRNKISIDRDMVAQTLLLHDIGKIIHFDFVNSIHFLGEESENVEYWKQVQKDFIARFGGEEHAAMLAIAKEIGVSNEISCLLDEFGSTPVKRKIETDNWNLKICTYADFRTAPYGIVSVNERFDELNKRYKQKGRSQQEIEVLETDRVHCIELEQQLQPHLQISPSEISDESISTYYSQLSQYIIAGNNNETKTKEE